MSNGSKHDLLVLLSALLCVLGSGIGAMLLFAFTIGIQLFGPPDAPLSGIKAIVVLASFLLLLAIGLTVGGALWIVVAARILPRPIMLKWLQYGPEVPVLTRLSLRLFNLVSKHGSDAPPVA